MNQESQEFISSILKEPEYLIEDLQCYFKNKNVSNENTLTFLSILSDYLSQSSENNTDMFLKLLKKEIVDDNVYVMFDKVLKDNVKEITDINNEIEKEKFKENKLVDIEWKFIGSASLEQADNKVFEPRIILKFIYSNGFTEIIESDYSNFKKLQEEFELASQSYNSAYSRKLIVFSK